METQETILQNPLDPSPEIWINSQICRKCCFSDKSFSAVWPCSLAHGRVIYNREDCPKMFPQGPFHFTAKENRIETQTL